MVVCRTSDCVVIAAIAIALTWTTVVHGNPHGVAVVAPVYPVAIAPVYPVVPAYPGYYAVPRRCFRKPYACLRFYGPVADPYAYAPPPPPPPPRPYYGGGGGGVQIAVAAVGVGVGIGK